MIRCFVILLALTVCLGASFSGAAPAYIPLLDDFESYSTGQFFGDGSWVIGDTSGVAYVQTTNVVAGEDFNADAVAGTKALEANLCDLTLQIDAAENATNAWFMFYAKPTPYNDTVLPAVPTNDTAAFYVNSSGQVKAMDYNVWTTVATSVPTDEWLAFAVQLNYVDDYYNLYLSKDNTFGTVLTKLNALPLSTGDNSSNVRLTEFTVEGVALLDAIALQEDNLFQSKSNLMVTALSLTPGEQTQIGALAHDYDNTEDHLGAELGQDLFRWLQDNDELTLFDTQAQLFIRDSGEPTGWDDTYAGLTPSAAHVPAGTGFWIEKSGGTEPYVAFMDYDALSTVDKVVLGTGDGGGGMNVLAWDKPTASGELGQNGAGFGANNCGQTKDKIYINVPGGKAATSLKRLYWDDLNNRWMDGASPSQDILKPGAVFWYYRGGSVGAGAWDLENAD